jgi:hypothetical protein
LAKEGSESPSEADARRRRKTLFPTLLKCAPFMSFPEKSERRAVQAAWFPVGDFLGPVVFFTGGENSMKWRKNVFGRLLAPAVMFVLGTSAYGEENPPCPESRTSFKRPFEAREEGPA